ncbi:MAG TPA: hypothetical protein EYH06_04025 [Chromatiales bacterium]|nr:hypothetical protein [Chromatiales bacterium]
MTPPEKLGTKPQKEISGKPDRLFLIAWHSVHNKRMQKIILLLVLLSFSEIVFSERLCVTDDSQSEVCLQEPAKKIITLSPHATELIFYVGAGEQVAGAIDGRNYPGAARNIQSVGDYRSVSVEKIISLKPDLIVAWPSGNSASALAQLQGVGLNIYYSEPADFSGIEENIKELAVLTGNKDVVGKLIRTIKIKRSELMRRYLGREKIRAAILVSANPLMTLSGKHAVQEAFELCGAENIFRDLPAIAPLVSKESMLSVKPEIIFSTFSVKNKSDWLSSLGFKGKNKPELFTLDPDYILLQTPGILEGIKQFCVEVDTVRKKRAAKLPAK